MRLRTFGTLTIEGSAGDASASPITGRRLAVLAVLAAAGSRGVSRERLLGILWPDVEEELARHTLSQTLYALRRDTGRDCVTGTTMLRLHDGIDCDVARFHAALDAGALEDAVALHVGPFLDGFYLARAPEFERWAERTREQLQSQLRKALEALAWRARANDAHQDAAELWRRLGELDPYSVTYASARLQALADAGDRSAALRFAREHEARIRRDLDTDVDPTLRTLIASLRMPSEPALQAEPSRDDATTAIPVVDLAQLPRHPSASSQEGSLPPAASRGRSSRFSMLASTATITVAIALAAASFFLRASTGATDTPRASQGGVAAALYAEGLRAIFANNAVSAARLMSAALEKDSTFALAAYFGWLSNRLANRMEDAERLLPRVRRLAARAPDHDRRFITASLANYDAPLPEYLDAARAFAVRYPADADGQLLLGFALSRAGDWKGSVASFDSAVRLDSAAGLVSAPNCRVCTALHEMSHSYLWWDSTAAAERAARRLIALRPNEGTGWSALVDPLLRQGRRAEGEAAAIRATAHGESREHEDGLLDRDLVRSGRSRELETRLVAELRHAPPERRGERPWLLAFALRNQGRFDEALRLAGGGELPGGGGTLVGYREDVALAIVPLETGDALTSARRFLSMIDVDRASNDSSGFGVRVRSWHMALAATSLVAAGDTAQARALADSVERIAVRSSFGRDTRLAPYIRALLLQRAGRHAEAVSDFRTSLFSLTEGYTRINLAMARSLVALDRPDEAIAVLEPAMRGGLDGGNSYVTHTELHEALAQAFEAAAQRAERRTRALVRSGAPSRTIGVAGMWDDPASLRAAAASHWEAVERGWRHADPSLRSRYERARARARGRSMTVAARN